jgi:hypothetical protein
MFLDSRREDKMSEMNGSKHYPDSVSSKFSPESGFDLMIIIFWEMIIIIVTAVETSNLTGFDLL